MERAKAIIASLLGLVAQALPPLQVLEVPATPVPKGKRLVFVKDGYKPVPVDTRRSARVHEVHDLESLLAYAKRNGSPGGSVLFCSAEEFVLVLDDQGMDEDSCYMPERIVYKPGLSTPAKAWKERMNTKLGHVKFKEFIEDREAEIQDASLLMAVAQFRARTSLEYSANLDDDGKKIGFIVETRTGTETVRLPRTFSIRIPIFRGDAVKAFEEARGEEDYGRMLPKPYVVEFRLEHSDLDAGGSKVTFCIRPRNWPDVVDEAVGDLMKEAKEKLGSDWLVVQGSPRSVGPESPGQRW